MSPKDSLEQGRPVSDVYRHIGQTLSPKDSLEQGRPVSDVYRHIGPTLTTLTTKDSLEQGRPVSDVYIGQTLNANIKIMAYPPLSIITSVYDYRMMDILP